MSEAFYSLIFIRYFFPHTTILHNIRKTMSPLLERRKPDRIYVNCHRVLLVRFQLSYVHLSYTNTKSYLTPSLARDLGTLRYTKSIDSLIQLPLL